MKNASQCAKQFNALLKKLGPPAPVERPDADDPIAVLVHSFLIWESTTDKALTAYRNIRNNVVDFNDLRVSMPQETVELIGVRYPRALDRAQRLRATLRDIYAREHAVSLDVLQSMGKREVRKYVETLEGIVPYVSARLMLLSFGVHAIPVDDQLRTQLIAIDAADASCEVPELASWLERHVKASHGSKVHQSLQSWIDVGGAAAFTTASRRRGTKRKKISKTTRKKKTVATFPAAATNAREAR